jgi:hypothetical protein
MKSRKDVSFVVRQCADGCVRMYGGIRTRLCLCMRVNIRDGIHVGVVIGAHIGAGAGRALMVDAVPIGFVPACTAARMRLRSVASLAVVSAVSVVPVAEFGRMVCHDRSFLRSDG